MGKAGNNDPAAWVLLGHRKGDNNQLITLADALQIPYRAITLEYNWLRRLPPRLLGASTASLTPASRAALRSPAPNLVLGIGYRSVPAALAIRRRSGGKTKLVRVGNPRFNPRRFDLVITTPQYSVRDGPNVFRLPLALTAKRPDRPTNDERAWFAARPRPHRLLIAGGPTFMWTLRPKDIAKAAGCLRSGTKREGGTVIAVTSPRTPSSVAEALRRVLGSDLVDGGFPSYHALLGDADDITVTGDSVLMVSESIMTGKPTQLIAPSMTLAGKLLYFCARLTGRWVLVRDLRRFWKELERQRLIGASAPAGRTQVQPLDLAVSAIRKIIGAS
jgi:mitochondrial fission protein ELM1